MNPISYESGFLPTFLYMTLFQKARFHSIIVPLDRLIEFYSYLMLFIVLSLLTYRTHRRTRNNQEQESCPPGHVLTMVTEQTGTEKVEVRRPCWTPPCPKRYDFVPVYQTVTKCVRVIKR